MQFCRVGHPPQAYQAFSKDRILILYRSTVIKALFSISSPWVPITFNRIFPWFLAGMSTSLIIEGWGLLKTKTRSPKSLSAVTIVKPSTQAFLRISSSPGSFPASGTHWTSNPAARRSFTAKPEIQLSKQPHNQAARAGSTLSWATIL